MNVVRIDDGQDPRLAEYAGVREPERLRASGLLIAEGRFVVRRVLASGRIRLRSLLLNDAALMAMRDQLEKTDQAGDVYVAAADVITAATGFNMHHGCLALAERPLVPTMAEVLPTSRFVTVLERVIDADNVGSVFRNAEAFGVDAVFLSPGCGDPLYRKAIRTSSGAALEVPWAAAEPWPDALDQLRASGMFVAAAVPGADATDIGTFAGTASARGRIAIMFGTEGQGLTDEALARADVRIRIPMSGTIDSLNIATAAGITMHRLHEVRGAR